MVHRKGRLCKKLPPMSASFRSFLAETRKEQCLFRIPGKKNSQNVFNFLFIYAIMGLIIAIYIVKEFLNGTF